MSIHFEEVTGEIAPPECRGEAPEAAPPQAPAGDFEERLEAALRLRADRALRLDDA